MPENLYQRLQIAAKSHSRSINNELIAQLEQTLSVSRKDGSEHIQAARNLRKKVKSNLIDIADINAAKRLGRP